MSAYCRVLTIECSLLSAYCRVFTRVLIAGCLLQSAYCRGLTAGPSLQRAYCRTLIAEALNMRAYIRMLTALMATIRSGKSKLNTHMQSMIPSLTTMCGCESMNRKRSEQLFITLLTSYTWEDCRWVLLSSLCCSHFTIKMHHFYKNILAHNKRIVSLCY